MSRARLSISSQLARLALRLERSRSGLSTQQRTIDGVDYAYLEGGKGETLVLIHGIGADKDNFTRTARWLTAHFHVIVPDLPGFGESTRLPESAGYTPQQQMQRLRGFVRSFTDLPVHLGGSSMGGWISLEYAACHPEEVASLWLLAPGGVGGAANSEMLELYEQTGRSVLFVDRAEDYGQILDIVFARRPYLPKMLRQMLGERAAVDHELHQAAFKAIHGSARLEDRVAGLATPARIVWGEQDRVLDVSGAAILHGLLPNSELKLLHGVGHLPMAERPRLAASDYLKFQTRLRAALSAPA